MSMVPQQCQDEPYGFNAIMVIDNESFPIRMDPRPFTEYQNDATLCESEADTEDVGIVEAMSQLSSPPVAPTMRTRADGGPASATQHSRTTNGVESLGVSNGNLPGLGESPASGSEEDV